VAAMIRTTAGHDPRLTQDHGDYNDTALFLDLDLSTLALPYEAFSANGARIRAEYPHINDAAFNEGRKAFAAEYLGKEKLYFHPVTAPLFEARAQENLRRLLA